MLWNVVATVVVTVVVQVSSFRHLPTSTVVRRQRSILQDPILNTATVFHSPALFYSPILLFAEKKVAGESKLLRASQRRRKARSVPDKEAEDDEDADIDEIERAFRKYYRATVAAGEEMGKDDFMAYEVIQNMLKEYLVMEDDLDDLWQSFVGDSTSVNMSEGYELVLMITDLPDPETERRWTKAFKTLCKTNQADSVSLTTLLRWSEMKELLADEENGLTQSELEGLYAEEAGASGVLTLKDFLRLNRRIDVVLDQKAEAEEEEKDNDKEEEDELSGAEVWEAGYEVSSALDAQGIQELRSAFQSLCNPEDNTVNFNSFRSWTAEEELLNLDEADDEDILQIIWRTALQFTQKQTDRSKKSPGLITGISLDAFLRANVQLEILYSEYTEDLAALTKETSPENVTKRDAKSPSKSTTTSSEPTNDDASAFYRREFQQLSAKGPVTLQRVLQWSEVASLLDENQLSLRQITQVFSSLTSPRNVDTLDEASFLLFNDLLDLLLESSSANSASTAVSGDAVEGSDSPTVQNSKREVPAALLADATSMPMPRENVMSSSALQNRGRSSEKTAGDNEADETDNEEEEAKMLEALDRAEALLTQRSFSAFDSLIGDENDPRLLSMQQTQQEFLRLQQEDANEATKATQKQQTIDQREIARSVKKLVDLCRPFALLGCGVQDKARASEETAADIRFAFQETLDQVAATSQGSLARRVPFNQVDNMLYLVRYTAYVWLLIDLI